MKKSIVKLLFVSSFSVISLTGCQNSEEALTVYDKNSRLFGAIEIDQKNPNVSLPETKENMIFTPLTTYHLKNKGDIPYVEVGQLVNSLSQELKYYVYGGMSSGIKEDGLHIYSSDKKGEFILNAKTDEVKVKNTPAFTVPITKYNNGISGDYCVIRNNTVSESEKSKAFREDGSQIPEYEVYNFKDYGFDIFEKDDNYYVPFEALMKLMFRDIGLDFAYNGKEFYINNTGSFTSSLINSSKGYWKSYSGLYSPSKSKGENEAYRFEYEGEMVLDESGKMETVTRYMVLNDDPGKTGYCMLCKGKELDPSKSIPDPESTYTYTWQKEDNILQIKVNSEGSPLGDYLIHLDETRFLKGTVSKEVSEYNYNILRLMFDKLYGLRDIKGFTSADAYFSSLGLKEALKSTNTKTYNEALAKLIGNVDDGHSSLNALSIYTAFEDYDSLGDLMKNNIGPRVTSLMEKRNTYSKARIDKHAELHPDDPQKGNTDPNYYQGLRFSDNKETAVITFDSFTHNSDIIKNMKELWPEGSHIEESEYLIQSRSKMINSTPDGFTTSFFILKELNKNSKVVKNVVVDLTNNGGGLIATVPYLMAFFTDDPVYAIKDINTGAIKEYHYKINLNGDDKYSEGDTFKGQFSFYVLTSGFSFSCGNVLPGLAKNAGAKIIGERSGGGVSPVGVYLDALGTAINISDHYNMLYKDADGKYIQNDSGIPVDYEFPLENGNWYDPNAINSFINSLK